MVSENIFNRAAAAALFFFLLIAVPSAAQVVKYEYPSQERVARQVDSIMGTLSVREKIAQIMIIEFDSKDGKKKRALQNALVQKEKIGGLIPMNDDLIPAMERMNELHTLSKIPMLVTIDAEWGASMRYWDEIPQFPRQMQLGALSSDSLVYRMGYLMGKECRLLKMQVNYAPDIDINNNPANPAINTRSFGEDKEKVARYGIAIMEGMRDAGVAGSAKHFPGHGDTDVDSHLALPCLNFDYTRLDTLEMYPFRHLIAADVDMVMVAHMNIPALDSSGRPSSISYPVITELLKGKLGYKGIVCTDALNMAGVSKESGLKQKDIPLAAFKAGADILLMPEDVENAITVIEKAVKSGEVTLASLDEKVRKVLSLKSRLGLFESGYSPFVEIEGLEQKVIVEENLDLMQQIAKNSITVLYNDNSLGNGLPLDITSKKIAYLGYKKAEIGREFAKVAMKYAPIDTVILDSNLTIGDLEAAKESLRGYDLVIVGFNDTDQRPHKGYGINEQEYRFITSWAKEQPMVAIYLGSPYALTKIEGYKNFTAFVIGYSSTPANSFAAAQVVFGGTPAIGVLPVSSADYPAGHSVVLPYRFREEYSNLVGSKEEAFENMQIELDSKSSAYLTVLPQVCELIGCGKAVADEFGSSLDSNPSEQDIAVLQSLLGKYGPSRSFAEKTARMLELLEMRHTTVGPDGIVATTKSDMMKFSFMINNNGVYAGRRVLSSAAALMMQRLAEGFICGR